MYHFKTIELYLYIILADHESINHPVHFVTKTDQISLSAFIPFCEFGGNMSSVGHFIDYYNIFICNSFQAKTLNDQLCYEVDLNKFSNKDNIEKELKTGFVFIMDYNEDRQVKFDGNNLERSNDGLATRIMGTDDNKQATIYLNSIGNDT